MARYKILYWHGIPVQVRAEDENGRANRRMPNRFQLAIDEIAMETGMIGDDDYTDGFLWSEEIEQEGGAEEVAKALVDSLTAQYPKIDVQEYAGKLANKTKR
jgi:hypothetical protein